MEKVLCVVSEVEIDTRVLLHFTQVGPKDWNDEHSIEKLVQQVRDANMIITPMVPTTPVLSPLMVSTYTTNRVLGTKMFCLGLLESLKKATILFCVSNSSI